jgi:ATP-binding cassette subfamily B protein
MLIIGIYLFKNNEYEDALKTLAIYFAASFRILPSILKVNNLIVGMRSGLSDSGDFIKILEELGKNKKSMADSSSQFIESGVSRKSYPIILNNISVKYDDKLVFDHVNLKIYQGEKVSITGASGCGKTTLIEATLGLKDLYFGESLIFGKIPSAYRLENPTSISYIGQYPFILDRPLKENIAFGIENTKIDSVKMNELIKQLDLQHLDERTSLHKIDQNHKFSGGERQRIAIGRALYQNAKILILDEPTSSLDEKNEKSMFELLLNLPTSITVVMVTHNLNWAKKFNKCYMIDNLQLKSI